MSDTAQGGLRTLVVGIDGASLDVLSDRGDGVIPTIRGLMESGATGPLESQLPPWTPSAWPSMYTGVNPGKHGVFSFLRFDGYDWDVVNYTDVREHTLWEILGMQGVRSVVVNAPLTHPAAPFDGALVPGYIAPEGPTCHPEGLLGELQDEFGGYRLYNDEVGDDTDRTESIRAYHELVEMRGNAFRYLVDRFEPSFGFVQFQQTDTVFHEHPDDEAVVDGVFTAVDSEIAAILETCDPNVVVLLSDHGLGRYTGYEFRVNSFLRDHDVVETVAGEGGMPSWNAIVRNRLQQGVGGGQPDPTRLERIIRAAARVGVTSQRIEIVVRALGVEDLVVRLVPVDAIRAGTETVDFERSTAYLRDRIELGVRLNLEGREPSGVVDPDDYESVRGSLIESLSTVRTPGGDPVFDAVLRREEVFHGPYVDDAPDVVLVPAEFDQYLSASLRDEQFGPPSQPWNHKLHGFLTVAGDVETQVDLAGAHLLDVAPTVLATLGVPASDRMDGRTLPVVEDTGVESYQPYDGGDADTDDRDVERRLADLGYLE